MDDLLGIIFYSALLIVAGMLLQWSGFLPWVAAKLPWNKG